MSVLDHSHVVRFLGICLTADHQVGVHDLHMTIRCRLPRRLILQLLLVTEYLGGGSLKSKLQSMTLQQKKAVLIKICEAVQYLHRHGILHREILLMFSCPVSGRI